MDWFSILLIIGLGVILLLVELLFIPGTTFVGLIGTVLAIIGIVLTYTTFGAAQGTLVLVLTVVAGTAAAVYSFRSGVWRRFSLKTSNKGRVNEDRPMALSVGDTGLTTSALRPFGKAEFGNQLYEVRTLGDYLGSETEVKIVSISNQKIIVEPLTNNME